MTNGNLFGHELKSNIAIGVNLVMECFFRD